MLEALVAVWAFKNDLIRSVLDVVDTDKLFELLENIVLGGSARNTSSLRLLGSLACAALDLTAR